MSVHTQLSWPLTPTLGLPLVGGQVTHPLEPWVSRAKVQPPPWGWPLYGWGPIAARVQQPLPPSTPWGADPPISSPHPLARSGGREDQSHVTSPSEGTPVWAQASPHLCPTPETPMDTHRERLQTGRQGCLSCTRNSFLTSSSPHPRSQEDGGLKVPGVAQAPLPKWGRAE